MMKKIYERPEMMMEGFRAEEFCTTCVNGIPDVLHCNAGILHPDTAYEYCDPCDLYLFETNGMCNPGTENMLTPDTIKQPAQNEFDELIYDADPSDPTGSFTACKTKFNRTEVGSISRGFLDHHSNDSTADVNSNYPIEVLIWGDSATGYHAMLATTRS